MKRVLKIFIRAYRLLVSPAFSALGTSCRFHPTCSEYAEQAIETKPLGEAMKLIAWRLMRCGPWTAGGVDHVPACKG